MEGQVNKKQNRKVTIFAVILSVISIGLLVGGFLLVSSNEVVMLQSISNLASKFDGFLDNSSLYDKIASSKDVGIKANLNLASDYANVNANLSIDYLENQEDKKSKMVLGLSMNDQKLLGAEGALANDNVYFFVDDITPNYYYTALEYVNVISSLKGKDYEKLLDLLKKSVSDCINNDDINKEKVEITYNGKNKKVNKLSYAVTNKALAEMVTHFVDSLKKDKELLENVATYMGKTTDELQTELNNLVKEFTVDEVEVGLYYNVYYYGFNKIVRYELADSNHKPVIEYTVGEQEVINFYVEEQVIFSIETKKQKDQYEISGFLYNSEEDKKMPFTGSLKGDTLTLVVNQDGVDVQLVIASKEEMKDSNYVSKTTITISGKSQGIEVEIGTLEINLEYYFDQKVNIDLSNSVNITEISETDLAIMESNAMNHPIYQLFSEVFSGLSALSEFSL